MAFAAVMSLQNTIQSLLKSSRISIPSLSRGLVKPAYKAVLSIQKVLKRSGKSRNRSERLKTLEEQVRETACKFEDVLESHVSNTILSQSENPAEDETDPISFFVSLEELSQDIDRFVQMMKEMKEELIKELDNAVLPEEENDQDAVSASTDLGGKKTKMVGLVDQYCQIRDHVLRVDSNPCISILGMAGIGKTTLAKNILEDPLVVRRFECRSIVRVGPNPEFKKIMQAILAQHNPDSEEMLMEGDKRLVKYFCKQLIGKKCLIVLDDVWSIEFWYKFKKTLPRGNNEIRILLTTRIRGATVQDSISDMYEIRFMNEEESWHLFHEKVFAEKVCPRQLEKAGKKIVENCEGLPLFIATVADLLSKAKKTPEYWNEVAANKEHAIFMDAYNQISKVLYPSYDYLPEYLKACFLYMGAFPQNYVAYRARLINLWSAEGFLDKKIYVTRFLKELDGNSIVVVHQRDLLDEAKDCRLHFVFWLLCKIEAARNKFLHILNHYVDGATEGMQNQRRLSIQKNILFGIKDVYNSMASISTARSLLCTGAYHQYQVPICSDLRLLRVLDALTIRLYEFPIEVLELVQLKYLAITYNGNIPPSISKLWNLQYLTVYQHLSIRFAVAESYLPVEIWDLKELKYLQIMGRNLPNPRGRTLPNLSKLLDVGAYTCTKGVLKSIPNLEKLRVQIELAPNTAKLLRCFDHISHLCEITSLQYIIVNPEIRFEVVAPPPALSFSRFYIEKLTLSGFGYPWKDMNMIAKMRGLKVLKLQNYAFRGDKWEAKDEGFKSLFNLSIEDTDLVDWTIEDGTFQFLGFLTLKHCYKLRVIPKTPYLEKIDLVDCNPSLVTCAEQAVADHPRGRGRVYSYSSI